MSRFRILPIAVPAVFLTLACSLLTPTVTRVAPAMPPGEPVDESPAPDQFTLVTPHPAEGDLRTVLAAHSLRAQQEGRRPFVEFSADWCPPCVALARSLGDERMIEAFRGTYIIRLDYDEWESRLPGSGFRVIGVPAFFEIDSDGRPTGRMVTGAAWGADTPENMAPPLQAFFRSDKGP